MLSTRLGLAIAGAALLVGATPAGAATKNPPLAFAHVGPGTGKLAGLDPAAAFPPGSRPPNGLRIVASPLLDSPAGLQVRGTATCPGSKVAIGGAVFVASTDVLANVNSSFPTANGWTGDVNNASGEATQFQVIAVCARRPKGYALVGSAVTPNPAGVQSTAVAFCPGGTAPLGGGVESFSFSTAVNINSTFPLGQLAAWRADQNNATGAPTSFAAFAVCGRIKGYTLIQTEDFAVEAGAQRFQLAECPAPTVPLSAGVLFNTSDLRANLNGMRPDGSFWEIFVNNGSPFDATYGLFAVCAGR
jgi:hypothetical protein